MLLSILETKLKELQWVVTTQSGVRTTSETNLRPDLDDLGRHGCRSDPGATR